MYLSSRISFMWFILWALEGGVVQVAMSVALDEVETGATEFTNTYINIITCS